MAEPTTTSNMTDGNKIEEEITMEESKIAETGGKNNFLLYIIIFIIGTAVFSGFFVYLRAGKEKAIIIDYDSSQEELVSIPVASEPAEPLDKSLIVRLIRKENQEHCLTELEKLNDDEMIREIYNLTNEEKTRFNNTVMTPKLYRDINGYMIDYLTCEAQTKGDQESYDRAKNYIEEIIRKEEDRDKKERLQSELKKNDSFLAKLAMGDLDKICPNDLSRMCLNDAFSYMLTVEYVESCNNICSLLDQYSKNPELLNSEIMSFTEWSEDIYDRQSQYILVTAIAYRFEGAESAMNICNKAPENIRNGCFARVDNIMRNDCNIAHKNLVDFICSR